MAGKHRYLLIALALCGVGHFTVALHATDAKPTNSNAALEAADDDPPGVELPRNPEARRKALEKMNPETREKLRRNFEKWKNLSDEEKQELRKRFADRKERMHKEIAEAIEKSGLELTDAEKREFSRKYQQGRRRIEQDLREVRKRKIEELVQRLKESFGKEEKPEPSAPPARD